MSAEKLEVDISRGMCLYLRCTVDTRKWSKLQDVYSPEFQFQGGVWKLRYSKYRTYYSLELCKRYGSVSPNPLHVSVRVESSVDGRIVDVLPEVRRFTDEFEEEGDLLFIIGNYIWEKSEDEIVESVPEFRLHGILNLIVVLKVEDSDSKSLQAEYGVPEATGQFRPQTAAGQSRSTSVQTTLLMNVLPCMESLSKDLAQMMADDSHHDVEFQCAGLTTKAHKLIVGKRSPVIASMLSTDMVEGRTGVVNIPDMAPDIFAQFMRYIYCGQLEELTFDTALRLYEAGDQYEVLGLAKRCSEFLLEHLSVDNAYNLLVVADAHNNKECVEKVIDYMVENRVPLISEEWSAFCDEHSKLANKVLNRGWKVFAK